MTEPRVGDTFFRVDTVKIVDDCGTNNRGKRIFEAVGDHGYRFTVATGDLIEHSDENVELITRLTRNG